MDIDDLHDAARFASKAAFPTDILVITSGVRVMARDGGILASRHVAFLDIEVCDRNLVVDAVRAVNAQLKAAS